MRCIGKFSVRFVMICEILPTDNLKKCYISARVIGPNGAKLSVSALETNRHESSPEKRLPVTLHITSCYSLFLAYEYLCVIQYNLHLFRIGSHAEAQVHFREVRIQPPEISVKMGNKINCSILEASAGETEGIYRHEQAPHANADTRLLY